MKRSFFLAFGLASVVVAVAGQGCSSSSSPGSDAGTAKDATNDTTSPQDSSTQDSSSTEDSGVQDTGPAAPSCPAVTEAQAVLTGPSTADWACATTGCCDEFTACLNDPNCVAIALCYSKCDAGNPTTCLEECAATVDAGVDGGAAVTTAVGEASAALQCLGNCIANPTLDGGVPAVTSDAGDAGSTSDASGGDAESDAAGDAAGE